MALPIFVPLIHADRAGNFIPGEFVLTPAPDGGLDITFTPKAEADLEIYLPSRGLFFFVPVTDSPVTLTLPGGPTLTLTTSAVAIQLVKPEELLGGLTAVPNAPRSVATWWVIDHVDSSQFRAGLEAGFDAAMLVQLAQQRGYGTDTAAFLDAMEAGVTSITYDYRDATGSDESSPKSIGRLVGSVGQAVTVRLTAFYGWGDAALPTYSVMPSTDGLLAIGLLQAASVTPPVVQHPLAEQAGLGLTTGALSFYVSFQFWEAKNAGPGIVAATEVDKGAFKTLPENTAVRLVSVNLSNPDDRVDVASGRLNASGLLEFDSPNGPTQSLARAMLAVDGARTLAFLVEPLQTSFVTQYQRDGAPRAPDADLGWKSATGSWPYEWLTFGLTAATGEPGSLTELSTLQATSFGLPEAPVVYNIGIPVFLQIDYVRLLATASVYSTTYERAPKGLKVLVQNSANTDLAEFRTDEHGQVWGLLTRWDPRDTNVRVMVNYEVEDRTGPGSAYPVGLPRIVGVVEGGTAPEPQFNSAWLDPFNQPFGVSGPFTGSSIGLPSGAAQATALARVRIGAVNVGVQPADGASFYESDVPSLIAVPNPGRLFGEHGALVHALKTLRHAHEWWSLLTDSVGSLITGHQAEEAETKTRWADLFDRLHRAHPAPPILNVVVRYELDPSVRGGLGVVQQAGTDLFQLTLLGQPTWAASQTFENPPSSGVLTPVAPNELTLVWNHGTVHHEFAHLVFLTATELFGANAASLTQAEGAYDRQYDAFTLSADFYTPLLEGVSHIFNLATTGSFSGVPFRTDPVSGATLLFTAPPASSLVPINQDDRMGLNALGAVASAYWAFLSAGPSSLAPIPDTTFPDLRDDPLANSIKRSDVGERFQRALWLPLRALRIPDHRSDGTWDTPTGRVWYPTSFSLIRHLVEDSDCYPTMNASDQYRITSAFGTFNPTSWYLWRDF